MELESMKSLWQAQEREKKLVSTVSNDILQRMIREKSHSALEKMRHTEYLVGSLTLLFFALFLLMGSKVGSSVEMIVSYTITIVAFAIEFCVSVYKVVYLSRIDVSGGAVTDTVKKAQWFQLFITRERIISIAAVFIVAPAVYICVYRWTQHESALDHLPFTIAEIVITVVACIIFSLIVYRRAYLHHIHSILANLEEIKDFTKRIKLII